MAAPRVHGAAAAPSACIDALLLTEQHANTALRNQHKCHENLGYACERSCARSCDRTQDTSLLRLLRRHTWALKDRPPRALKDCPP